MNMYNLLNNINALTLVALFSIAVISFIYSWTVKNSDVIKIEDVDMVVIRKHSFHFNYSRFNSHPTTTYRIFLKSIDGKSKSDILYTNLDTYNECNRGDIISVQRIFYKYKNNIFSEVAYARNEHRSMLQEYLNNNDMDVDDLISKSKNIKKVSSPLYYRTMTILGIILIINYFILIFV